MTLFKKIKKRTYVIAEIGVNHNGKFSIAKKMIKEAKNFGADAVKFQIFSALNLSKRNAKLAPYQSKNLNKDISQFDMLKRLELRASDYFELRRHCKKIKIDFICSVFDESSIDFYKNNFPSSIIKIPSGEITNYFLLKKLDFNSSEIILSTGMSNLNEIANAVNVISNKKIYKLNKNKIGILNLKRLNNLNKKLFILHCISDYPTDKKFLNLNVIEKMSKQLNLVCGFSDHSDSLDAGSLAVAKGAKIIEKHFTLNKKFIGPDHKCSLNIKEFSVYIKKIRDAEKMLGQETKKIQSCEKKNILSVRKSLVAKKEIKRGQLIKLSMLTAKRPAKGLSPMQYRKFVNKRSKKNFKIDDLIK